MQNLCNKLFTLMAMGCMACQLMDKQPNSPPDSANPSGDTIISINLANNSIKIINATLSEEPDISENAQLNLQRIKARFAKIDSLVSTYPDYETAKKHLTPNQIALYENEDLYSREDHLDVGAVGCSWYCGGGPERIIASSVLAPNKGFTYVAANAHDFSLRTAWVNNDSANKGIGQSITFCFPQQSAPVSTVEIYNGYMKSEKAWQNNARVKQLKLYVNDKPYALLNLQDTKAKQSFAMDTLYPANAELCLKFEITAVYEGAKYADVAIAEINFDGIGVHCFAAGTLVATPTGQCPIESLQIGQTIMALNEQNGLPEPVVIQGLVSSMHHNLYQLQFSNTTIVATNDHPFYSFGSFAAITPGHQYGLQTATLRPGTNVFSLMPYAGSAALLKTIRAVSGCHTAYAITGLSQHRIYFANGLAVAAE
ncbi:MAG TPA: hypothetical protein PKD90_05895 [Phnomibacter sp.]|nr:hypothetical protein [Phnomibacter sp.]